MQSSVKADSSVMLSDICLQNRSSIYGAEGGNSALSINFVTIIGMQLLPTQKKITMMNINMKTFSIV